MISRQVIRSFINEGTIQDRVLLELTGDFGYDLALTDEDVVFIRWTPELSDTPQPVGVPDDMADALAMIREHAETNELNLDIWMD